MVLLCFEVKTTRAGNREALRRTIRLNGTVVFLIATNHSFADP
jgi:hypothetical protein